ncbi:Hypothetical protein D9617_24g016410 [Elsinoe fawcettii]|nr:Hypothetical protein D9617_24g016410 [Elsinoe fawcettii]
MVEPTEENVSLVVDFAATDPETARRYLRVKNNSVEQAVNALFEGEDITKLEDAVQWDDSAWATDRDGSSYGPSMPAPYSDSNLHPLGTSAAPTRGSSPVPSFRQPATKAEEDEELEKAMANSRQDLGYGAQESGVISGGNRQQSHFGPATQSQYDPSQWAMVPTAASNVHETREIIPDVEASARKNDGLEPRFLKHTASGDYLPNLLTIAHSIPLARETLLLRNHVQRSYGQDPDWWRGHEIKLPQIVNTEDDRPVQTINPEMPKLVAEMQRLMAFLDASDRSYASTEPISKIAERLAHNQGDIPMDLALSAWEAAAQYVVKEAQQDNPEISHLFRSTVGSGGGVPNPNLWSLPLPVPERPRNGEVSLADAMDHALWDMDPEDENFADNWMERCGEILPMRVAEDDSAQDKLRLVVPTSLYIDKYLKEHIEATRPIRKEMARLKRRQATIETLQHNLANVEHPTKKENLGALDVLKSTRDYFSGTARQQVLENFEGRGIDLPAHALALPESEQATHDTMAQKLDALWNSITEKIETLEEEKHKAKKALSQLSQSNPPGLEHDKLKHHYTLRGVATKPNVTYVLRPRYKQVATETTAPPSDAMDTSTASLPPLASRIEIDTSPNEDDPDAPPGWVWWRIQLDISLSNSTIHKTESSTDDVLRAVELEHNAALLVYASDRAVNYPSDPTLPDELRRFVAADNKLFANELRNASGGAGDEWNDEWRHVERRGSGGSTMVNFDEDQDRELPAYSFQGGYGDEKGLGSEAYTGQEYGYGGRGRESPEAHEIRLDEPEEGRGEMVQTGPAMGMGGALSGVGGVEKGQGEGKYSGVGAGTGTSRAESVHMVDVDDERAKGG